MENSPNFFKIRNRLDGVELREPQKLIKRRLRRKVKKILFLLIVFIISSLVYCIFFSNTAKIKNIYIKGENLVSEEEILNLANIKHYPNYYTTLKSNIISKLKEHELIKEVKVRKHSKRIYIEVVEHQVLLEYGSKYIIDNGQALDINVFDVKPIFYGDEILLENQVFIDELYNLYTESYDSYAQISEIQFTPNKFNEKRLTLIMRDQNTVLVSYDDFAYKLFFYFEIIENLQEKRPNEKGVIDLESTIDCNEDCNYEFRPY